MADEERKKLKELIEKQRKVLAASKEAGKKTS